MASVSLTFAQTTPSGNNTLAPLSSEGQAPSPIGQTDFQTDPFTGRFAYSVPFDLAPARHGSSPNIEMTYNSANPNSWCGVGWDLDLGYIERETKYGVPVQWSSGKPVLAYDDSKGFLFSFKNKTSDLTQISSGNYRAQIESDFLQFQYYSSTNTWIVTDKSGNEYIFGSASGSRMTNPKSGWSTSGDAGTFRWALDTIITATGDKATISYTSVGGRLYPQTYSYNGHTAGISALATVNFYLTSTNRTDTTISCRSAYAVTNQFLLSAITHSVNGQMIWSNKLNYVTSGSTMRSLLTSVTHYGSDLSSTLPPLNFGYSQQSFGFQTPVHWTNLAEPPSPPGYSPSDLVLYQAMNNPACDLIDVDGDGLPDRIIAPDETTSTEWWVQHNTGSGFANPVPWTLATQSGGSYNTSTDPSWAQFNTHGRVIDINGDGWPDRITDPISMFVSPDTYPNHEVQLSSGTNLATQGSWTNVIDQYSNPYYSADGNYRAVENYPYVAMLDMNGDGLPDRVMTQPGGNMTNYLVQFNTGSGYGGTNLFGGFYAQGFTNNINWNGLSGNVGGNGSGVSMRLMDINGDGLPDRVMLIRATGSSGVAAPQNQTYLVVELNNGYGFEPAINWTNVNAYYNISCGGGSTPGISDLGDDYQVAYRDINGDGLPDRLIACQCTPYTSWLVQINTGTGFGPITTWSPVNSQGQTTTPAYSGIQTTTTNGLVVNGVAMLLDMNGDGLPDRVEYANPGNNNYYVVELSSGPFPDLMIAASNGLGGVVSASYTPATQWDNRASTTASPAQYLLPFPLYTVSSVSVSDGINSADTTTYNYTGGYWNYSQHQFNGFAQTTVSDPLNMTNVHWFHQAGGRNNSANGEYQDSTTAIGKTGMEWRTDTIGSDGNPYATVLNKVVEAIPNIGEHFAYIAQTIGIDYPATSSSYKATAQQYTYNTANGNLLGETNWGQVNSVSIANQTFSDVAGDTLYRLITYASLSNPNIVDKPSLVTLSLDSGGSTVLRQESYSYNGGTGLTLQENDLICSGSYRTTTYGYDTYNNKIWQTNADGVVTHTVYDSTYETFPTSATEGGSFTTSTTYDPRSGKLYLSTDPAGLVTSNRYDVFLRLAETDCSTTPNGATSEWLDKYTYTLGLSSGAPNNSVLRQESDGVDLSNGHQTISWFDGLGRTIQLRKESETSGSYRVVDSVYDKRGNVEFTSVPYINSSGTSRTTPANGLGTLRGYDPVGRPNQLTAAVSASFTSGVLTSTTATSGDSGSPVAASSISYYNGTDPWTWVVTDETGSVHRYTRDAYERTNQIVEVNGSQSYTTALSWNLVGDLLSVTDNSNNVITYSNNLMGEVVAMADPDIGVWTCQRDYAGRLRVQTDGDSQSIHFNYSPDPLGRLLSRQVYDLKGNFYYGVTNVYDSSSDPNFTVYAGQLYQTIDSEGYTKYGYDVRGRKIITARYLSKNGNTYTNHYIFDDMDRTRFVAYPNNGPTVTNIYDSGANLSKVQLIGGAGTAYYQATSFTPLDQISGITYGNGVTATYSYYSNSKRLQSAVTSGGLQSLSYTYDQVADILSISDSDYSGAASAAISSVSYDGLHRLLGFTRPGTSQTVSCTYDAIGNMMSYSENGSGNYTYTVPVGIRLPHAIKSANGVTYTYDPCGNMLTRGSESLVYNPENRLIGSANNGVTATFGYDSSGNRLWKQGAPTNSLQVWIGGIYEEKDGKVLFHISAGDRLVYTYSSDGTVAEYYHPDNLHSAEIMSTAAGGLYQHYEYAAYGSSRYTSSATAFPVSRRYTSQVFDEETGLYYFGARYYDPVIGRFIQPDQEIPNPFNPQAYDRYAYCYGNPLKYFDPDGHAGYWADVGQVWLGYYDAGVGVVQGSVFAIAHPITTVEGVGSAVAHPINTVQGIASTVGQDWNSGPRGQGRVVGTVLIAVGVAVAPAADAGEAAQAGQAASAASRAEEAGTAVQNTANGASADAAGAATDTGNTSTAGAGGGRMKPDPNAQGPHTVFKVDPKTGKVTKYQTFEPQTNPRDPKPWKSTKRVDTQHGEPDRHFNKSTGKDVPTPHVHDPETPGGVRPAAPNELPQ